MSKFKPSRGTATGEGILDAKPRRERSRPWDKLATSIIDSSAPLEISRAASAPTLPLDAPHPAREFAFKCTLIFLYFRFSFVHEFVASNIHFDTHVLVILGLISYAAWFVAGSIFSAYRDRLAWVWTGFVFWLCIATLTSSWKGGSLAVTLPYIRTVFPLLLLIPAVTATLDELKRALNLIGIAGTTTVLFGLVHRDFSAGRMDIGTEGGTIQDPNDLAAHLIILLPAIAYVLFAKQRSVFVKIFGVGIVLAALLEIMSTGSRGGFVALLITVFFIALVGSPKLRFAIFVGAPLLGMLALPFVPKESVLRLKSIFNSSDASESAAESSAARRALLMASLKATAQHPIFGVGPGTFEEYEAGMAAERNERGMWHETHNGYTQISSECGIPALLLYLAAVTITFRSLKRASNLNLPVIPTVARTLAVMAVGYSASLIFLANAFRFYMLVIGAFTIAMNQIILRYQKAEH